MVVGVFLSHEAGGCSEMVGDDAEGPSIIGFDGRHVEGTGETALF